MLAEYSTANLTRTTSALDSALNLTSDAPHEFLNSRWFVSSRQLNKRNHNAMVTAWTSSIQSKYFPSTETNIHTGFVQKSDLVFQTFPGQNYTFFQTFQGILFIFMWTKTLQNWLLNAEISCIMYSSILCTECDSIFELWTSNALCYELQEN